MTPRIHWFFAIATICFCAACVPPASAVTTNLPPAADTALRSTAPDNNFGAYTPLPVGSSFSGSPVNRVLLRFDLSAIPTNAVVSSATLKVILAADPTAAADFGVHRVLKQWGEGSGTAPPSSGGGGTPAAPNEATWNSRLHLTATWGAPGGLAGTDYLSVASSTNQLTGGGGATNSFASLASDVQLWVQKPNTNFGWFLIAVGEPAATGKLIGSKEDPATAPILIVEYSLPTPAVPPVLFNPTITNNQFRFSFNAQSNRTYTIEFRGLLGTTTAWSILGTSEPFSADTVISVQQALTSTQRFYRVRTQ